MLTDAEVQKGVWGGRVCAFRDLEEIQGRLLLLLLFKKLVAGGYSLKPV